MATKKGGGKTGNGKVVVLRGRDGEAPGERTASTRRLSPRRSQSETAKVRTVRALELRQAGASYQAIGDTLGISKQAVWTLIQKAMREMSETIRAEVEEVRALELDRLDRMQLGVWPRAAGGDIKAIEAVLRIMDRRSRLLGLDAMPGQSGFEAGDMVVTVQYVDSWKTD